MLVVMTCTMLVAAPITMVGGIFMAVREDVGLSWLVAVAVPVLAVIDRPHRQPDGPAVPARCRRTSTASTGCCASRSPASGWSARSSASRTRPSASATANAELTDTAIRAGRLMALMFPIVMLVLNVSSVAVLWFGASPGGGRDDARSAR